MMKRAFIVTFMLKILTVNCHACHQGPYHAHNSFFLLTVPRRLQGK